MPVQGLMKLAATVAANNKKRKNALQIQKYIGEGKGSNPNKRSSGDPIVNSQKQFTQTGAIGVEITNPDEEQGIQQRRNAKEREREEKRKRIEQNKEKRRQQREGGNTDT